jgi:hypothetical protein
MSPRAKRIRAEPAPQGRPANLSDQPLRDHFTPNLEKRKSVVTASDAGVHRRTP